MTDTGEILRALRLGRGMTQEQLAERLFVSRELVSKWELGQRRPDIRALSAIAGLFGVEIEDLADTEALAGELSACLPPERPLSAAQLLALLGPFLATVSERDRAVFLRRYYFLEDAAAIGALFGIKENHVRSILARTRKKLKAYLKGAST